MLVCKMLGTIKFNLHYDQIFHIDESNEFNNRLIDKVLK